MRIIGIDPGLRNMGWGVIEGSGNRFKHIANGVCRSDGDDLSERLLSLMFQLREILTEHEPDLASIELTFVNKDAANSLKLGQARGVALVTLAEFGLKIAEYAPNKIKKTVVGVGHADKNQVAHMIGLQFAGVKTAGPDAVDALAIALCHAHHAGSAQNLENAIKRAMA